MTKPYFYPSFAGDGDETIVSRNGGIWGPQGAKVYTGPFPVPEPKVEAPVQEERDLVEMARAIGHPTLLSQCPLIPRRATFIPLDAIRTAGTSPEPQL